LVFTHAIIIEAPINIYDSATRAVDHRTTGLSIGIYIHTDDSNNNIIFRTFIPSLTALIYIHICIYTLDSLSHAQETGLYS